MAHTHDHHEHHGHDHHGHGHHAHHLMGRKLGFAFALTFLILAVLCIGAWWSNSLALWADAGHVITDLGALGLSWYATHQATRPADPLRTFGYHRTGILAALANAVALIVIAIVILYEAYGRFSHQQMVHSPMMIASASIGLLLNLGIGALLMSDSEHNLNVRSAFLHVLGDAAASAGVIVGAIVIALTGWLVTDPLLSAAIAVLIAYGAWQVLDESVHILMEGTPRHLDLARLVNELQAIDGVQGLHDLHVWSIASGMTSLSCHLLINDAHIQESIAIVARCNQVLRDTFDIGHTTIQAEAVHCSPDATDCNLALTQPAHDHDHDHDHGHGHDPHHAHH